MCDFCLQCFKPLVHLPGKKKKRYCDKVCKKLYWNSKSKSRKKKSMPISDWQLIERQLEEYRQLKEQYTKQVPVPPPPEIKKEIPQPAIEVIKKTSDMPDPQTNRTGYMKWLRDNNNKK